MNMPEEKRFEWSYVITQHGKPVVTYLGDDANDECMRDLKYLQYHGDGYAATPSLVLRKADAYTNKVTP
jgi:hypothetical protein